MTEQKLSIHISNSELDNYKAVVDIVNMVDWARVSSVMKHLDWKWYNCESEGGIPQWHELSKSALELSYDAVVRTLSCKHGCRGGTGGIEYHTTYFDDGSVGLKVMFVLTDWDNYL